MIWYASAVVMMVVLGLYFWVYSRLQEIEEELARSYDELKKEVKAAKELQTWLETWEKRVADCENYLTKLDLANANMRTAILEVNKERKPAPVRPRNFSEFRNLVDETEVTP